MGFGRKGLVPGQEPADLTGVPNGIGNSHPAGRQVSHGARQFDITPKPLIMILCLLFFGAVAVFLFFEVLDPRGVIINGFITLGPLGADIFFGVLALSAAAASFVGGAGLVSSMTGKSYLTLDAHSIEGRAGRLSRKPTRIAYASIADVSLNEYEGTHIVKILGNNGEKIRLGSADFRSEDEFAEFLDLLNQRLAGARL